MIRRMEERDLAAVAELEKLCFSENWSYHILESGIHSPYDVYYVFEQEGKIRGYCNLPRKCIPRPVPCSCPV